jgi:hypothetical protein
MARQRSAGHVCLGPHAFALADHVHASAGVGAGQRTRSWPHLRQALDSRARLARPVAVLALARCLRARGSRFAGACAGTHTLCSLRCLPVCS